MLVVVFFIYVFFLLGVYYLVTKSHRAFRNNLFNPINIIYLWYIVELPYLLWVAIDPEILNEGVVSQLDNIWWAYSHLLLVKALFIVIYSLSIYFLVKRSSTLDVDSIRFNIKKYSSWFINVHLIYLILGGIAYILFLQSIGGLSFVWSNLATKTTITAGTGYFRALWFYLLISSLIFAAAAYRVRVGYFVILTVLIALLSGSIGDRTPILKVVLTAIFSWHVFKKGIVIKIDYRLILLIFVLAIIFISMPMLRTPGALDQFIMNPDVFVDAFTENWHNLIRRFSDINRSLFAFSYFDLDNIWFGKSYLDLLYAPIPRSMLEGKPPIDDGFYLYNLFLGNEVTPPAAFEDMYINSWPFSSITIGFANFWYIGVVLNAFLTAIIASYSFRLIKAGSLMSLFFGFFIYLQFVTNTFQLTNHGLVNSLLAVLLLASLFQLSRVLRSILLCVLAKLSPNNS